MTVRQILVKARALIKKGWTKGRYHRKVGGRNCYCAAGAILRASGGRVGGLDSAWFTGGAAAARALCEAVGAVCVPEFNDKKSRTKAQVLRAFDKAIKAQSREARGGA